jgi:hypothetical protein
MIQDMLTSVLQVIRDLPLLAALKVVCLASLPGPEVPALFPAGPELPFIHHTHLRYASIAGSGEAASLPMVLPNLERLVMREILPLAYVASSIAMFLSRSKCQLTELAVRLSEPRFEESSWRQLWEPLGEAGLVETSVHETVGGVIEETWSQDSGKGTPS